MILTAISDEWVQGQATDKFYELKIYEVFIN